MTGYQDFLTSKKLKYTASGINVSPDEIHHSLFPFQRDLTRWELRKGKCVLAADTGLGKALDIDTLVLTPVGHKKIGKIKQGDYVIGASGKPIKVGGVFPQGMRGAYRVTFSDDVSIVCDAEHLWAVRTKVHKYRKQDYKIMRLKDILASGLHQPSQNGNKWFVPVTDAVQFPVADLPIDSYVLGVLLGDGYLGKKYSIYISSADDEILDAVRERLPSGFCLHHKSRYDWRVTSGTQWLRNPMRRQLADLGLMGSKSETKFIPDCYKFSGVQSRIALLQGLLDTDGHVRPDNNIEYITVSHQLAHDVAFLINSLGGTARIRTKETGKQLAYRMSVILPDEVIPFRLTRKRAVYRPRPKYKPVRSIKSVEHVGKREMVCISVNSPDGLFLLEHCIVTHNTRMFLEFCRLCGADRALIVAPLVTVKQTRREGSIINVPVHIVRSQDTVDAYGRGIFITNYEMIGKFDPNKFDAIVLDEASIIKHETGKYRKRLTENWRNVPFRVCATATPAPNDIKEMGSYAQFLGVMTIAEMKAAFFVNRTTKKAKKAGRQGWSLKGHAEEAFYRWLASWCMSVTLPSDLGYDDAGFILPPMNVYPEFVKTDYVPEGQLVFTGLSGVGDRAKVRKSTLDSRVSRAIEIVNDHRDDTFVVWCGLNPESNALARGIEDSVEVIGSQSPEEKANRLESFLEGKHRVLVTKPSIAGYGMNFQHVCHNQIFVGLSDSWEQYRQAWARLRRFGQTKTVNTWVILADVEDAIWHNVMKKQAQAEKMNKELIANVIQYEREELEAIEQRDKYNPTVAFRLPEFLQ